MENINFTYDLEDYIEIKKQFCKSLGRKNYKKYIQKLRSQGEQIELTEEMDHEDDPIKMILDNIIEQVLSCQEQLYEDCDPNFLLGSAYVTFATWQDA